MARKAKNVNATEPKVRRTPEQQIADLQAKIAAVERRAAAKAVKQSDSGRAFMVAVKALDKAIAASTGDTLRVVEGARAMLGEHLIAMGVRAPVSRPRKNEAA